MPTINANFAHAGTVSHGTLRQQDLLRSFANKLMVMHGTENASRETLDLFNAAHNSAWYLDRFDGVDSPFANMRIEGAHHTIEALTDALDNLAPEGWYFGTLEGDASDFGFWPISVEA